MKISYVIPSYNHNELIDDCLESIHAQAGVDDYEVIVSHSGAEISLKQTHYDKVHLLNSRSQLFPGEARNRGISSAKGDFIVCVDFDVILDSAWTQTAISALNSERRVVCSSLRNLNQDCSYWSDVLFYFDFFRMAYPKERMSFFQSNNFMASKQLMDENRFKGLRIAEDQLFFAQAKSKGVTFACLKKARASHVTKPHWFVRPLQCGQGALLNAIYVRNGFMCLLFFILWPLSPFIKIAIVLRHLLNASKLKHLNLVPGIAIASLIYSIGILWGLFEWIFFRGRLVHTGEEHTEK